MLSVWSASCRPARVGLLERDVSKNGYSLQPGQRKKTVSHQDFRSRQDADLNSRQVRPDPVSRHPPREPHLRLDQGAISGPALRELGPVERPAPAESAAQGCSKWWVRSGCLSDQRLGRKLYPCRSRPGQTWTNQQRTNARSQFPSSGFSAPFQAQHWAAN
jgi:hypothetical protein